MKKTLSELLFTSNLARDTLLLLNEGPKNIDSIISMLKTSRQALYPPIRVLRDENLIRHEDGLCRITAAGRLIVYKLLPLLETLDLLDELRDYELDFIPQHLLKRMGELYPCDIIDPSLVEICDMNKEFHRKSTESESVIAITTFMFPNFSEIFADYTEQKIPVSVVIPAKLHDKLKSEHHEDYKNLILNDLVEIYVKNGNLDLVSFTQNDYGFMLRLLSSVDHLQCDYKQILFHNPTSLGWGRDLFKYYKNRSVQVTDI